jgi:large subunit ribosomal protein L28
MAKRCDVCGKGPMSGNQISFSHRVTHRRFMPNVSKRTLVYEGRKQKIMVCANCLRTLNKSK